jgi:1-acyl-sn-glycerol-3-phosphate acyltransferase
VLKVVHVIWMLVKYFFAVLSTLLASVFALMAIPIDKTGNLFRLSPWFWSRSLLWIFGIKVQVQGYEQLDSSKSYIFVSNHASMCDIPAVIVALQGKVNIIFKKELTRVPIWGWALRYGHFIMIDRSNPREAMASIERAAASIRQGSSVILFAEGTRTSDGQLQPFKRGAFSLALKAMVPVVPVTLNGTFNVMPKGSFMVRSSHVSVFIDAPIETTSLNGKSGEVELMEKVHNSIEKHYIKQ